MSQLFEPIDLIPQWEKIYNLLEELNLKVGDEITYKQFTEALGVEFLPRRSVFYKAANKYGSKHKRAFAPVHGVGYRVVSAPEHEVLAKKHHKKSRRSLDRGKTALTNADRSLLTPEQQRHFDALEHTIGRHADMIRRLDERQAKTEKALEKTTSQQSVTDERVAALEEAMRRHGLTK